mmetsp:Transcript_139508/g.242680  ORF Transcript_139508/g.242680 Transcript_139508/m.242680 type:complete len:114 (+) Transcript_139508:661-1002(+)
MLASMVTQVMMMVNSPNTYVCVGGWGRHRVKCNNYILMAMHLMFFKNSGLQLLQSAVQCFLAARYSTETLNENDALDSCTPLPSCRRGKEITWIKCCWVIPLEHFTVDMIHVG